jgi:hypothetical protein
MSQVLQAKINDKETIVPKDFPSKLKELVIQGCSKEPKKRPRITDFRSALSKMLPDFSETKSSNDTCQAEVNFKKCCKQENITADQLRTNVEQGNYNFQSFSHIFSFYLFLSPSLPLSLPLSPSLSPSLPLSLPLSLLLSLSFSLSPRYKF